MNNNALHHLVTSKTSLVSLLAPALLTVIPLSASASTSGVAIVQQSADVLKGTVTDSQGEPIVGATVKVKGTTGGTISDIDGNFTVKAPAGAVLEISYVGFKTIEMKATAGMKVKLLEDSKQLNEVVVVGFGTQKKTNLTGSVAMVDGEELAARPVTTAAQALQGMVPGLQITQSSGSMDATASINVRGTATIGQGSSGSPLILVDGSEADINTINPQDIESISVLKDAAASSIYGSRAPFGVILITTKKGKNGKVTVNYNNSFRFSSPIRQKHMMNSVDFAAWMNDSYYNSGWGTYFNSDWMKRIQDYQNAKPVGPGTRQLADGTLVYGISSSNGQVWDDGYGNGIDDVDWYDAIYKNTTFSMEHTASVSGGSEKFNYYASFDYLNNNGLMKLSDDKFNRYASNARLNGKITDWLSFSYIARWTRTDFERPANLTDNLYNDLARQGWPILPLYDRNGYYYDSPSPALGLATAGKDNTQRDVLNQQVGLVIEPIKNWLTHVDFNYRVDQTMRHWGKTMTYQHNVAGEPYVRDTGNNVHNETTKENYFNFQAYTEYTFSLAEKHNFHVMGGFQAEQMKQTSFSAQRVGILDTSRPYLDLTTGYGYDGNSVTPTVSGAYNQWQTAGFFGRLNYNFDERYLIEANIRHDGTSRFRTNRMWKTFPSVSLGWNIAREKFWEPLTDVVNTLKLRASYGSLGNCNTTNWYQTYEKLDYKPSNGVWLQDGKKPNTVSAPSLVSDLLTWERIESYNIGLDFGLFNNRLTGSFDWYIRDTKDMVGNAPELPDILGTSVPVTNNTDLRTRGWELQIAWRDRLANGFSYGASVNLSDARTKITRYPNNPTNSIDTYIAGRYINEIWGYETEGIAKSQEEMDAHLKVADQSSISSESWGAGDVMYKDLNGDKKVTQGMRTLDDHGDLKVIGNSTPRYLMGINLNASWKGFDIQAFFQGVLKRDYCISSNWGGGLEYLFGATASGQWWSAGITDVKDYYRDANSWSVQNGYMSENTSSYLPRPRYSDMNCQAQSAYLLNAAYMRLKNLQVGYTLPKTWLSHLGLSNARIFVSLENLFTITNLPKQFDPETLSSKAANGYPLQKTYSFGINVTL